MPRDSHILAHAIDFPWAITPRMLQTVARVLATHVMRGEIDAQELIRREPAPPPAAGTGVAVIPLYGVIAPRANFLSEVSGTATFEDAISAVRDAADDPKVGTIVLDWDSPGGSVLFATEFAAVVLQARQRKRVISIANPQMCSAAYWTGACATELVATPSACVGSIGVYCIHEDLSEWLAKEGIKITYIAEGKYKVEGNEAEPLSDHARARLQKTVARYYDLFTRDVAAGRSIAVERVINGYGQGDAVTADEALALGLVDRIETFDETIARALTEPTPASRLAAAADAELEASMTRLLLASLSQGEPL